MTGIVYQSTGLWYRIKMEDGKIISSRLAGKNRLIEGKLTNPIAVGDSVVLIPSSDGSDMVIDSILPRRNYLIRKSPHKTEHSHIIASNIDLGIFVFTSKLPRTSRGFLDRFLICSEAYDIPVLILLHKWDQYDEKELNELGDILALYDQLGYSVASSSVVIPLGMEKIAKELKGKTSLLFGHSGAGKSSILNFLFPDLELKTSPLSDFSKKGKHATTFAQMFDLDDTSRVIDMPGIKEFALEDNIEDYEISQFFPEIKAAGENCKFYNCLHLHEPGCRVLEELENGMIDQGRYNSYRGLVEKGDFKSK
jgi:ribosome biogenesis GTPase / thiamine phosphate phosphatase